MANIRIVIDGPLVDGHRVTFKAPCNCTLVEYLDIRYVQDDKQVSKLFTMTDAHGGVLTQLGNLFTANAYVHAVLDTENGFAYLLNANTNSYLEGRFAELSKGANPNLLINGDFQVWRNGESFDITNTNSPIADKWQIRVAGNAYGTVKKASRGMVIDVGKDEVQLRQYVTTRLHGDRRYTLSAKINGEVYQLSSLGDDAATDQRFELVFTVDTPYVRVLLDPDMYSGSTTIEWVKLEEDDKATDYVSKTYTEELLLCMADELTSPAYENGNTLEY